MDEIVGAAIDRFFPQITKLACLACTADDFQERRSRMPSIRDRANRMSEVQSRCIRYGGPDGDADECRGRDSAYGRRIPGADGRSSRRASHPVPVLPALCRWPKTASTADLPADALMSARRRSHGALPEHGICQPLAEEIELTQALGSDEGTPVIGLGLGAQILAIAAGGSSAESNRPAASRSTP